MHSGEMYETSVGFPSDWQTGRCAKNRKLVTDNSKWLCSVTQQSLLDEPWILVTCGTSVGYVNEIGKRVAEVAWGC